MFRVWQSVVAAVAVVFAVLSGHGAGKCEWPAWLGGSERTGSIGVELPQRLNLVWKRELGMPIRAWPASQHKLQFDVSYEPVTAGGRLFVGSMRADHISAYECATGRELWRFYTDGPVRFAPVAWRGMLFAVSDDGCFYALEQATGRLIWRRRGAPHNLMVLGNDRLVSAWPARGGPVLYEEEDGGATLYAAAGIWPFMGTFIYALDAESGRVKWSNSGSGSMYLVQQHSSPAFSGVAPQGYMSVGKDVLLVSGGRTVPAAYNRHTGEYMYFDVSSRAFGKDAGGYGVVIAGERYYNNGCLYEIKDGTALLAFSTNRDFYKSDVRCYGDGFVKVSSGKEVAWYENKPIAKKEEKVDRKGRKYMQYSFEMPHKVVLAGEVAAARSHFVAGSRVFLSGKGGWIGAMALDGSSVEGGYWEGRVEGEVWAMVPGEGKLFVVTEGGVLYAFGDVAEGQRVVEHKAAAASMGEDVGISGPEGYAMVWGLEGIELEWLLRLAERFHVVGIEPDVGRVEKLRRVMEEVGVYGRKVHLIAGDPLEMELPAYLANLIYIGLDLDSVSAGVAARKAWHSLRPYGGVAGFKPRQGSGGGKGVAGRIRSRLTRGGQVQRGLQAFGAAAAQLKGEGAVYAVDLKGGVARLSRQGALPGSAFWTHENADVANTVLSQDNLVKPPLGMLWFGGPANDDILPRHGHGPAPQVAGGRLFIEGPDALRAVDVYNGRLLWQRSLPGLGKFYDNTAHQPGANEIGSNYVSGDDAVYVVYKRECLVLDPVTGDTMRSFTLPPQEAGGKPPYWGYIGVHGNYLIATVQPVSIKKGKSAEKPEDEEVLPELVVDVPYASSSSRLVVMDRFNGRVLWQRRSEHVFRHNAVIATKGMVYCIDGYSVAYLDALKRRGERVEKPAALLALDIASGRVRWRRDDDIFGTWLSYSEKHDLVFEGGSYGPDRATDEARDRMATYKGSSGEVVWRAKNRFRGRPILHDDVIYTDGLAFALETGLPVKRSHPITGAEMNWSYSRNYGCNTPVGGRHMLTFRSAAAGFYDLASDGGTGNWGGFKSGCTSNLIPADGLLNAPDYTRTCTCSYQNQCSLALVPMTNLVEHWTFQSFKTVGGPVQRLAINFGAPGDWPAPDGTLWFEYPSVGGRGPDLELKVSGKPSWYRRHALEFRGEVRPVVASGVEGATTIRIPLNESEKALYSVRVFFAEPERVRAGERVFDVVMQGKTVLAGLDVAAQAGGARREFSRGFSGVAAGESLELELRSVEGSRFPPVLSGIQIVREGGSVAGVDDKGDSAREVCLN